MTRQARGHAPHWIVVGAGWSGLACAVEAARRGVAVTVLDAAPAVGGRARRVDLRIGDRDFSLDNGQHLLIGACTQTLALMRHLDVDPSSAFLEQPFTLRYPDGWRLSAARAPAPLHLALGLLAARRLPWSHRAALAGWVRTQQRHAWQLDVDVPVDRVLAAQPPELVRRLWRPLCIAAMNAEPEDTSARMFLNLLRLSLGGAESDSRLLLTRRDLTATLPQAAVKYLQSRGATVRLRQPVLGLTRGADGWCVALRDEVVGADRVILAVPADSAARLLECAGADRLRGAIEDLAQLQYEPLATVYLRYAARTSLPAPLYALLDDPAQGRYGQWVFDRGRIDAAHESILSVVVGAPALRHERDRDALCRAACRQLREDFGLPASIDQSVVIERRATLRPGVALRRPPARLPVPGLYLAGDVAASAFPSTLEGSVRAGLEAACAAAEDQARLTSP